MLALIAVQSPPGLTGEAGERHSSARLRFPSLSLPCKLKLALLPRYIGDPGHVSVPVGAVLTGGVAAQVIFLCVQFLSTGGETV